MDDCGLPGAWLARQSFTRDGTDCTPGADASQPEPGEGLADGIQGFLGTTFHWTTYLLTVPAGQRLPAYAVSGLEGFAGIAKAAEALGGGQDLR